MNERGQVLSWSLSPGQTSDYTPANGLLERARKAVHQTARFVYVVADRGYDSDAIVAKFERLGWEPVNPPRQVRVKLRLYDRRAYRSRNIIERYFGHLKNFRRIATRHDKTAVSFSGFVAFAMLLRSRRWGKRTKLSDPPAGYPNHGNT